MTRARFLDNTVDRADEASQLARDRGHGDGLRFAFLDQLPVTVQ